jgi:hypothetical protein
MSNLSFCDECGYYILPGKEEVLLRGGTFEILCKRCYKQKLAAQDAITGANEASRISQVGVEAEND